MQINELVDIAICIADTNPSHPKAADYIVSCMEDLKDVLHQNKVDALTVDTFGRRIDKLCRFAFSPLDFIVRDQIWMKMYSSLIMDTI